MPTAHASCLAMLEPVMTLSEGAPIYAPTGTLLEAGDLLVQPGLVAALEAVAREGAAPSTRAASRRRCSPTERGGVVTARRSRGLRGALGGAGRGRLRGRRASSLAPGCPACRSCSRTCPGCANSPTDRVLALVEALDGGGSPGHTTNLAVVDGDGRAFVLTTSLGLGSGDFLPGLDLHLNSMLGEDGPARRRRSRRVRGCRA